eukprot:scaffold42714_cov36-Phaeocystis_antarctica.AAC.1
MGGEVGAGVEPIAKRIARLEAALGWGAVAGALEHAPGEALGTPGWSDGGEECRGAGEPSSSSPSTAATAAASVSVLPGGGEGGSEGVEGCFGGGVPSSSPAAAAAAAATATAAANVDADADADAAACHRRGEVPSARHRRGGYVRVRV